MPGPTVSALAVVILPGLDGVGGLRARFGAALGDPLEPVLVSFPRDEVLGYAELMSVVEIEMARHERFILLGESFSGPLVLKLAARNPKGMVGLVLCATFATLPRPWLRAFAPVIDSLPLHAIPSRVLSWLLLGKWAEPARLAELVQALRTVELPVLRKRAKDVMSIDVSACLDQIGVPTLCLRGSADRLVPMRASNELCAGISNISIFDVDAPHALLQAVPEICAMHVRNFAKDLAAP